MIIDNANAQTEQLRTDNFKPFIHYNYHKLLCHTTWLEENIVADNLKEKIGNVSKIKQVTRQYKSHVSKRSSSLLGGGEEIMTGTSTREDTVTQERFSRCEHRQKSHHHGQDQSSSSSSKGHLSMYSVPHLNTRTSYLQIF